MRAANRGLPRVPARLAHTRIRPHPGVGANGWLRRGLAPAQACARRAEVRLAASDCPPRGAA
jgi:hypothetical protein